MMRTPSLITVLLGLILISGCVRVTELPNETPTNTDEATTPVEAATPDKDVQETSVDEVTTPEVASPEEVIEKFGDASYSLEITPEFASQVEEFHSRNVPLVDYHIHLRGDKAAGKDMTVEKAVTSQAKTGVRSGVLENAGIDWPLSDNEKIRKFIEAAEPFPVFIGLQVNDRDWFDAIAPELIARLDYVLADTMIMNDENGKPQKLWNENEYNVDDVDVWFDRYFAHCMTVINEQVTIMANPTWLPPRVAGHYDDLWTAERMTQLIDAAVKNEIAFEIQVGSAFPKDKFIELAKSKGAKFTIGRNNMDDRQPDFLPVFEKMRKHNLGTNDMLLLTPKR